MALKEAGGTPTLPDGFHVAELDNSLVRSHQRHPQHPGGGHNELVRRVAVKSLEFGAFMTS